MPSPNLIIKPIERRTPDGWILRGEALIPERPKAAAVLAHAMMVNRRAMDRPAGKGLASTLAAHDIAVFNFDLRGHGQSGPSASEGARFSYDDIVNRDLPTIVGATRSAAPDLPLTVIGHSLGAHAALFAAALWPPAAPDFIVSIAGNLWLTRFETNVTRRLLKKLVSRAWIATSSLRGHFDAKALRMGTDPEPIDYIRQLVSFYDTDRVTSLDGRTDYLAAMARLTLPVFSVESEGDRLLAHPDAIARFLAMAPHAPITRRVVLHGEQGRPAPDHMGLVTQPASRPLWDEIADWILSRAR